MKKLNQSGFSLIELMIVVAIIGILAAIAIPNYQSFQRKSRQAEARSMLGAYYSASAAASAEFNAHAGNFVAIGFKPAGQLTYRVTSGQNAALVINAAPANTLRDFNNAPSVAGCVNTSLANAACGGPTMAGYGNGAAAPNGWVERAAFVVAPVGCVAAAAGVGAASTFLTCASANLGAAQPDGWSINEDKLLVNTQNGV